MAKISIPSVLYATLALVMTLSLAACFGSSPAAPTTTPLAGSHVVYGPVAFADASKGLIAASTPAHTYVLRTTDGGRAWSQSVAPVRISQLAFPDTGHVFALVTPAACNPTSGPNARSIVLSGCHSGVMTSTDGGRTWQWLLRRSWPYEPMFFGFVNHTVGWVVFDRGQCLHVPKSLGTRTPKIWNCYRAGYKTSLVTDNGGVTWRRTLPRVGGLTDLTFTNARAGWALTAPGRKQLARLAAHPHPHNNGCFSSLLHSSDGGRIWLKRMRLKTRCQGSLSFVSPSTGYLLLTRCQATKCHQVVLYRTRNHGRQWARVWQSQATSSTNPKAAITGVLFKTLAVGWLSRAAAGKSLQAGLMTTNTSGHSWVWHFKNTAGTTRPNMAIANASDGWVVMTMPKCLPVCTRTYHTGDAGKTWSLVNLPVPVSPKK